MLHFAGILTVSVQSQAICKGKISHFPHCDFVESINNQRKVDLYSHVTKGKVN